MTQPAINQQARLAALYEVSSRLGTTLDVGELLNLVMDSIIQLTAAERGILMLIGGLGEHQFVVARTKGNEDIPLDDLNISRSVVQRAVDTQRPILTDNAQEDARFAQTQSVAGYQLRSIMCTPLLVRGTAIGAVYVDNRLMVGLFNEQDLELLVMFANQAAMAIDNAQLFQQTDEALRRRIDELTLFQRIDRELNQSLDLDHVLNLALDWGLRLTDSDGGTVGLLEQDEDGQAIVRLRVHRSQQAVSAVGRALPLTHPVLAELLATKQTVQTHAVKAEQALDGSPAAVQLAVPIQQEGEFLGVIALESHIVTTFLAEDVAFVSRLADRAAVAIKNSRLYAEIRAANEARSKFVSLVTHELRLPLTSINGYTDLLLKGLVGALSDTQKEMLNVVKRNATRMNALISDLSDLNRLEGGRMKLDLTRFALADVVEEVVDEWQKSTREKEQTLVVEETGGGATAVYADRSRVVQVLQGLISNAHKYTPSGGHITVRLGQTPTHALVEVVDTGIGIQPADQARLFEQFFRAEDSAVREQVGWGLGLAVVRLFVQHMGGEITFASEYGAGSTFAFTLPLHGE